MKEKGAHMKKRVLGFIALAMTFLATTAATADVVQDTIGAIRSIDPCDADGTILPEDSVYRTIEGARTVGDKAYFRIRLENWNSTAIYTLRNSTAYRPRNPWQFEYFLGGTPSDSTYAALQWVISPAKVGVIVSGRFVLADIDRSGEAEDEPWFTDLYCSYTVQPGDLAFPMLLANDKKKVASDSDTVNYYLGTGSGLASPWKLVSYTHADSLTKESWETSIATTNICKFSYGTGSWFPDVTGDGNLPATIVNDVTTDGDLHRAGLYIQAIDFDSKTEQDADGNEVWRAVHENSTSTAHIPSLYVPGDVITNGFVYLWTADKTSVRVMPGPTGKMETYGGEEVLKLNFNGTEESLQFRLRGVTKRTTTEIFLSSSPTNVYDDTHDLITNFVSRIVACTDPLAPTIQVLVNDTSMTDVNVTTNYQERLYPFEVKLTQVYPYNVPVTVKLQYRVNGQELVPTNLIAISKNVKGGYEDPLPTSITIEANETSSSATTTNPQYLYGLGALTAAGDVIEIIPSVADSAIDAFFQDKEPAVLNVHGMAPIITAVNGNPLNTLNDAENPVLQVRGGVPNTYKLRLNDSYRNMKKLNAGTNGYYKVVWSDDDGETTISNLVSGALLVPDGLGVLNVPFTFPVVSVQKVYHVSLTVFNAEDNYNEPPISFVVKVIPPKSSNVYAIGDVVFPDTSTTEAIYFGEGSKLPVTFSLSETPVAPEVYAFLEPISTVAKELTWAPFFVTNTLAEPIAKGYEVGTGVRFQNGVLTTTSKEPNFLVMVDNPNALTANSFQYRVRLCKTAKWDPAQEITEFVLGEREFSVTNNPPVIQTVMARNNNTGLDKYTEKDGAPLMMSLSDPMRTFRVSQLDDVDPDKNGVDADQIVYGWEIYKYDDSIKGYPTTPGMVVYKVGGDGALNMEELFGTTIAEEMCGTYRFVVRAQDKDMRGNKPNYLYLDNGVWYYDPWRGMDTGGAVAPVYPESGNPGNDWGPAYAFELRINKNPYIEMNPYGPFTSDNGMAVFSESDLLDKESRMGFSVAFNEKPGISGFLGIAVQVTIEAVDDTRVVTAADTDVVPQFTPTTFSFTASTYSNRFEFTDFDGTYMGKLRRPQLYRVVATVTSSAASPSGTPWNKLYTPATNYFRLANSAPNVTADVYGSYAEHTSQTNAVLASFHPTVGEMFNLTWTLEDVLGDQSAMDGHGLTNLIVECITDDRGTIAVVTNETFGTFSVSFLKEGSRKVRIKATDKDGDPGFSDWLYFEIDKSKRLLLYPIGPSQAAIGDGRMITKYLNASGLGIGRVWADGSFGSITAFVHTWNYLDVASATTYAQGYAAEEVDESTAGANISTAPDMNGTGTGKPPAEPFANTEASSWKSGQYHAYDNFFYRWFKKIAASQNGGGSSSSGSGNAQAAWSVVAPTPGKSSLTTVDLPEEAKDSSSYPDTSVVAIFSRELYKADNMGDINGDGIPDKYAVGIEYTAKLGDSGDGGSSGTSVKTLCEIATGQSLAADSESEGGSGGGGDGATEEPDLVKLHDYNDDGDFFPLAASSNPLKPTILDWRPMGREFNALLEIRGIGESEGADGEPSHLGLNEPGVSDYDLSPAETYALLADYVAAGNVLSGISADDYAAATNWAWQVRWTPEAVNNAGERLNPAAPDTDGDVFSDGWEYYFWYYAKIGAVTNGVWGRLEGRRYSFAEPATGTRIAPNEIVQAFNPHIPADIGRDFDHDGLTDFEEYILGTNPIDWDSDGDGMNDLWEVMNGLDPLSTSDGDGNPDRDFMARCEYDADTFTVFTFANGEMFGLPTKSSPAFTADPVVEASTNGYKLVVVEGGVTNTYIAVDQVANDGTALTADADGFKAFVDSDGQAYVEDFTLVTVATGTELVSAADTAEDYALASKYFKAVMDDKDETVIWFAEKPKVMMQDGTSLFLLVADTAGFSTYAYADGENYLGESRIFPAGTLFKFVADAASNMNPVKVEEYVDGLLGATGGFSWINPETLEREATSKALPLFNYGGDGKTYVPCSLNVTDFSLAPVVEDKDKKLTRSSIVKVEKKRKVTLIHNQVFNVYGFDPRTAWSIDDYGFVDVRWRTADSEKAASKGDAGRATRTKPYTSRDEYLVLQYRQQLRAIGEDGIRSTTDSLLHGGNGYLDYNAEGVEDYLMVRFRGETTYPNFPVSFVKQAYQERQEVSPFDNSTNRSIVAYWEWLEQEHDIHGADTDYDGIPDGWELYVNADPNDHDDGKLSDDWANDGDGLNLLREYAGVDSCNAYTNRFSVSDPSKLIYPEAETITQHHPGNGAAGGIGWWNKFFPTNPYDLDTDGDGLMDDAEGKSWSATFYVGNNPYVGTDFSFIYGREEHDDAYALNGTSICFRGGGLNPCTVDTDGDLLPDAWEFQFAGVVFKDGAPLSLKPSSLAPEKFADDCRIMTMADGKQGACPSSGSVIRGGMDGTYDGDDSYDFDHDGLANCQEYLVQTLRHLRYDDPFTPLMGIHPDTKEFLKFIPFSAWDGEAFHKRCLANGFTGLGAWQFRELGYFALPPHEWDPLALNTTGRNACKNYANSEGAGYRVLLPPVAYTQEYVYYYYVNGGMQYACTDPRRWDTDEDGMDDYYELFHGLNPLLGTSACPEERDQYDRLNMRYDVIATIHNGKLSAWKNSWTGWPIDRIQPAYDAIRFPWMIGTMECDADGDGLRNDEESIKVNLAQPSSTHTDPTPLWMTDSTSTKFASYTAQYYNPDPYIAEVPDYDPLLTYPDIFHFPWTDLGWYLKSGLGMAGANSLWMFAFEENEGYDTDHDFKRDAVELTGLPEDSTLKVEMASDPQQFTDPDRRQALYLPGLVNGVGSAAASRDGQFVRAVSTEPDLLKTFTVELWVKPDGVVSNAVLVERVCNYGPSTLSNNTSVIRANFRLGVDETGHAYGEYEGSTPNSGSVRVTAPNLLSTERWTHLAFAFNGTTASLYEDGEVAPVATAPNAGLIPANGVSGIQQEYYTTVIPYGYVTLPCMTVFGAGALNGSAIALDAQTTWNDFGSFFKGWIDEVRIWDGARTPTEIHENYRARFTMDDIKNMRSNEDKTGIFDQWAAGARRSIVNGLTLPAELLQHYNFVTLPGGVEPKNVLREPVEFQANVLDNVRKPNGKVLDSSLLAGWWSTTPVRSTVYRNYCIIPWIGNTVAHLPFLDGSSPDSQYWSSGFAGVMSPLLQGFTSYDYPDAANPYPYYFYRRDRFNRLEMLQAIEGGAAADSGSNATAVVSADSYAAKWQFQLRSDFIGTSDLVPLGGAFAKRATDFWDGQGAMDAWVETSKNGERPDANGNGIPDWAEALGLTTAEAYLRALAEGLLPDGTYAETYKAISDVNYDGVADWWQKMYGLRGSAHEDADMDGLADFAEYLISEKFFTNEVDRISPLLAKSNGKEFDYFRRAGKVYLGEIFSDHDFMEDHWEREWSEIGAEPEVYDAHLDSDEDGWSNWSEIRSKCNMGYGIVETSAILTNLVYDYFPDGLPPRDSACYLDFKQRLNELREKEVKEFQGIQDGDVEILDAQYTVVSASHVYHGDTVDAFMTPTGVDGETHNHPGIRGWIKYYTFTKVYKRDWKYPGQPAPSVLMTVRYNGIVDILGLNLKVEAYTDSDLKRPDATFYVQNKPLSQILGENRNVNTLFVGGNPDDTGHLREGKNTFVVSVVASNSTDLASTPAIMGIVRNVDVGWSKAEFEVELTDQSPICPRPALPEVTTSSGSSSSAAASSTAQPLDPSTHIYVYRYAVDEADPSFFDHGPIIAKEIGSRTSLHEGDFLSDTDFDLDWTGFQREVMNNIVVRTEDFPVTSVTYRVYLQPVDISGVSNDVPYVAFTRNFGQSRATAVPVSPGESETIFYGARPTFSWRMVGDRADTYTAFAIQVKSGNTVVWNSGKQLAPPRNVNGDYEWTAPLYAGDQTMFGKVFANTNNYTWSVTMYNAKYQSDDWSTNRTFRVNVYAADEPNAAGYYGLAAKVKYFGPGKVNTDASKTNGVLRVEAYTSPDFSGEPAGRTFVRDLTSLTNAAHEVNATIIGLKPGTYYVRAYLDSDGDFSRSDWESWGYACMRGDTVTKAIYAPTAFTVGDGVEMPTALVYVEDCDVDQDCLPDVWEYDEAGTDKTDFLLKKGPMENANNGYISVNPDLMASINDLINGGSSLRLLSAVPGRMSSAVAALMLGVPSVEPSLDEKTLAIKSLTLAEGTVTLTLGAEADDPAAGTVFVTDGLVRATVVVKYADSLDGEWGSKTVEIEKQIEEGAVSETLTFSLKELGLDASKGFFKVELK